VRFLEGVDRTDTCIGPHVHKKQTKGNTMVHYEYHTHSPHPFNLNHQFTKILNKSLNVTIMRRLNLFKPKYM
jgi:hypothetical protein